MAVHFIAVCERFASNDGGTTFEIESASELKDSKLSAACSLHTASHSNTSSTSSLRRRRLGEIVEEDEDEGRETKRRSLLNDKDTETDDNESLTPKSLAAVSSISENPVKLNSELATSPNQSQFSNTSTSEVPSFVGSAEDRPSSPVSMLSARRMSSQTTRTELYTSYSGYSYKPKIKLAPRPSNSTESSHRPQTAGNFKPVSAIPAGLKLFGKGANKKTKGNRDELLASPQSDDTVVTFPPLPVTPTLVPEELVRPNTSSGVSTASTTVTMSSKNANTREKARLKKAMQLREKRKKMSMLPPPIPKTESAEEVTPNDAGELDTAPPVETPTTADVEGEDFEVDEKRVTMIKADSGVAMEPVELIPSTEVDENTEIPQETVSPPTSPMIASSEPEPSTKASSVSDSTNETSHPKTESVEDTKSADDQQPTDEQINTPNPSELLAEEQAAKEDEPVEEKPVVSAEAATEQNPIVPVTTDGDVEDLSGLEKKQQLRMSQDPDRMLLKPLHYIPPSTVVETTTADDAIHTTVEEEEPAEKHEENQEEQLKEAFPSLPATDASEEPASLGVDNKTLQALEGNVTGSFVEPTLKTQEDLSKSLSNPGRSAADSGHEDAATDSEPPSLKPKSRRRVAPLPIKTNISEQNSQRTSIYTDDGLLDELQNATFEEATPMVVTKTPVTPVFPSSIHQDPHPPLPQHDHLDLNKPQMVRTISNPLRGGLITPTDVSQSSARSVSMGAAFLHKVTQQQTAANANLSKKGSKMGSGISQRIKALEKLQANMAPESPNQAGSRPSSTFFSVNKSRDPSRSPSVVDRANSFTRKTPESTATDQSRNPSPDAIRRRERTGSMVSRMSIFEASEGNSRPYTPQGGRESVSVTARINRDPNQPQEPQPDTGRLNFRQSTILVGHHAQTPVEDDFEPRRPSQETNRRTSQDGMKSKSRRSSLSAVKDFIKDRRSTLTSDSQETLTGSTRSPTTNDKQSSISNRLSMSSQFSRDNVTEASNSSDDTKSLSGEKRQSRAGRFMRRLSGLSSKGQTKTATTPPSISPTLAEEDEPLSLSAHLNPRPATTTGTPQIVAYMGDVNVQFPDTLLWKRRNMGLDSQGFLILSALPGTAQTSKMGQNTKRYHMSQFRSPYTPDVEVQELPNSVVLDLIEGSGVQLACEDRAGQMRVLSSKFISHYPPD